MGASCLPLPHFVAYSRIFLHPNEGIAVTPLETACSLYQPGRAGSILERRNERHFDVFSEYQRIFACLGGRPEIG